MKLKRKRQGETKRNVNIMHINNIFRWCRGTPLSYIQCFASNDKKLKRKMVARFLFHFSFVVRVKCFEAMNRVSEEKTRKKKKSKTKNQFEPTDRVVYISHVFQLVAFISLSCATECVNSRTFRQILCRSDERTQEKTDDNDINSKLERTKTMKLD